MPLFDAHPLDGWDVGRRTRDLYPAVPGPAHSGLGVVHERGLVLADPSAAALLGEAALLTDGHHRLPDRAGCGGEMGEGGLDDPVLGCEPRDVEADVLVVAGGEGGQLGKGRGARGAGQGRLTARGEAGRVPLGQGVDALLARP